MSRGIRLFKVPQQYPTKEDCVADSVLQYRDIIIVEPASYDEKMSVWQYLYVSPGVLDLQFVKYIDYTFTDNVIINNVTPARAAHQHDYRTLINTINGWAANRYGSEYFGKHDLVSAKLRWDDAGGRFEQYYNASALNFDFSSAIKFNAISDIYQYIRTILTLLPDSVNITAAFNVLGISTFTGDVNITGNVGVVGDVNITGHEYISNGIEVDNGAVISGNTSINDGTLTVNGGGKTTTIDGDSVETEAIRVTRSLSTNMVTSLNADMLDGVHLQEILDRMAWSYDSTEYRDSGQALVGYSIRLTINGQPFFIPASSRSNGVCYTCPYHSKHGSCHWMRMCHSWEKKQKVDGDK